MPQPPQPSSGANHVHVIVRPPTVPFTCPGAPGGRYGVPEADCPFGSQNRRVGALAGTAHESTVKSYCCPVVRFAGVEKPLEISSGELRSRPAIAGSTAVRDTFDCRSAGLPAGSVPALEASGSC